MNEENFKQLCDKALLLINGVSEEVFLYEDEKAFVGAWGGCDVAYDDNTVGAEYEGRCWVSSVKPNEGKMVFAISYNFAPQNEERQ